MFAEIGLCLHTEQSSRFLHKGPINRAARRPDSSAHKTARPYGAAASTPGHVLHFRTRHFSLGAGDPLPSPPPRPASTQEDTAAAKAFSGQLNCVCTPGDGAVSPSAQSGAFGDGSSQCVCTPPGSSPTMGVYAQERAGGSELRPRGSGGVGRPPMRAALWGPRSRARRAPCLPVTCASFLLSTWPPGFCYGFKGWWQRSVVERTWLEGQQKPFHVPAVYAPPLHLYPTDDDI